jgi:signal peptidase II
MKRNTIKFFLLISICISGCSLDLKTKDIAKDILKEKSISLIDNYFNLTYVENDAIAFGLLGNISSYIRIPLIFILTISVTLYIFYIIWKIRNSKIWLILPFFIILSGAYGNIIDRAFNGYVTDFFHAHYFFKYHFPVFNVADVLVNIGLILIIVQWKSTQKLFDEVFSKKSELTNELV